MDMKKLEALDELLEEAKDLPIRDDNKLDSLMRRTKMYIKNIFGESSEYLDELEVIKFYPSSAAERYANKDKWKEGKSSLVNLIETMIEELERFGNQRLEITEKETNHLIEGARRVFIAHGHDEEMKQAVARTLDKLDLESIILHEQPNKGRTIIEKFEEYSDVGFAVVLLSPDDRCFIKKEDEDIEQHRARQNVILELGFFIGKLGRNRVMALHKEGNEFEMPSDYDGVLYTAYDSKGNWKINLARELKAVGIDVDANKLID